MAVEATNTVYHSAYKPFLDFSYEVALAQGPFLMNLNSSST